MHTLLAAALVSQTLQVYSEFRRVGPDGTIIAADRGGQPREILSPAVARNAYVSFHVVVSVPAGKPYTLHIAQNPEGVVQPTLYREIHDNGIPDRLEEIQPPASGRATAAYWLDLWIPDKAEPRRIRVEAQLYVDDRWIIYPLEVRIGLARVPEYPVTFVELPPPASPADVFASAPWRVAICGEPERTTQVGPLTVRELIRRNWLQDLALARSQKRLDSQEMWCGPRLWTDPEQYLRAVRDRLLRHD